MTIKNLTVNADRSVTMTDELGNIVSLPSALAGALHQQMQKIDVRDAIRYAVADADGDTISLGSFDGTDEEFIDEVFSTFEDEIECGNIPSEEEIQDAVIDTASTYGIVIDD